MITQDDLRAAVGAGLLTEAQAASLLTLATDRQTGRARAQGLDEPFELFRGFNEVFIVVGLGILGGGWIGIWQLAIFASGDFRTTTLMAGGLTALVLALLSEYFVRRRRMVAPALALTIGWAVNAVVFWLTLMDAYSVLGGVEWAGSVIPAGLTTLTIGAFWARYRVPFAMALMAVGAFAFLILALGTVAGDVRGWQDLFLLSASGPFAWGTLLFGIVLFAIAMWFDMSDPHRLSLRSANGFWLHVAAAPAIVNTLALTLIDDGSPVALAILAVVLCALALIAVIIDRRSFLISAVGYIVALVALVTEGEGTPSLVLLLGAGLVGLGAGWQWVRARLLRPVPQLIRNGLPPSA
ncbi:MAG: hypothetical protein AAFY65_16110 [Pseudomonadota bacterium]